MAGFIFNHNLKIAAIHCMIDALNQTCILSLIMETLSNIECFVASAELGSFSAAARKLAISPAAVSRNVAQLETNLGTRLFIRNTRNLALTEIGEQFLIQVRTGLQSIQQALECVNFKQAAPQGKLKISLSLGFALKYILPLLPDFMARYPGIIPDFSFENRHVDLIAEGFDAAIGVNIDLNPTLIARNMAPLHVVAVASPAFLQRQPAIQCIEDLQQLPGIVLRSMQSGKIRNWQLQHCVPQVAVEADKVQLVQPVKAVFDDTEAVASAAMAGMGIALLPLPDVLPQLETGCLHRVLPEWYADVGQVSIYYSAQKHMPLKLRVFIDFLLEAFQQQNYRQRFSACKPSSLYDEPRFDESTTA